MTSAPLLERKEILFAPAPATSVADVENRFRNQGVRFGWVNGEEELVNRLKRTSPFLLVVDLSKMDPSRCRVLSHMEDCLNRCKTLTFGGNHYPQTYWMTPLREIVCFQEALDASVLASSLERILQDGWGPFKNTCIGKNPYHLLLCHSHRMERVRAIVDQVAPTDITPLIQGERGTGKELVAQAIHFMSSRRHKPLVKVNCGAIAPELLESEMFGLERGTFSGGYGQRPGKFEIANGGTTLFDEIGDLDPSLQEKLLRVLQGREFSRVGGEGGIAFETRIIASTRSDLENVVAVGLFREDLYHHLNVVRILVPPLRDRKEEIPSLTRYFLHVYNARYGKSYPDFSRKTFDAFLSYDWPENVRELQHAVRRIVVLNDEAAVVGEIIGRHQVLLGTAAQPAPPLQTLEPGPGNLRDVGRRAAKEAERVVIQRMLEQTRWNRRQAAELLQISYKALLYKIKEYGLDQ